MFLLVYPIKKSQIVFVNPFWIVSAFFHTYLRYESSASEPDSAIPRSFQIKQEGFLVDDSHADKYIIGSQFSDMPVFIFFFFFAGEISVSISNNCNTWI